jgi:trimethylamine:corrinoid methyltransferase-like protein
LPDIDFVMSGAWPDGMEAREAYPRQFNAMAKATTKPLVMTAGGVDTDRWLETGGPDATEKARRKARQLLATHKPPALAGDVIARMDAVIVRT